MWKRETKSEKCITDYPKKKFGKILVNTSRSASVSTVPCSKSTNQFLLIITRRNNLLPPETVSAKVPYSVVLEAISVIVLLSCIEWQRKKPANNNHKLTVRLTLYQPLFVEAFFRVFLARWLGCGKCSVTRNSNSKNNSNVKVVNVTLHDRQGELHICPLALARTDTHTHTRTLRTFRFV